MEKTSAKSAISKRRKRDVTAGGRADRLLSYLFFYRTRCHWLYISSLLLSTMAKQRTEPLGRTHRSIDPLFMWIYPLKKRRGFFRPGKTPFFLSPAWGAYQISMLRRKRACRQPLYSFFLSFALNLYLLGKKSLQYVPVFVLNIGIVLLMLISVFYFSSPSKLGRNKTLGSISLLVVLVPSCTLRFNMQPEFLLNFEQHTIFFSLDTKKCNKEEAV